jgi:hypothetical protein
MKEILGHPGCFEMDQAAMPHGPEELTFHPYLLPMTFGRTESEEAAARFISICQEVGQWCGVSVIRMQEMLMDDFKVFADFRVAQDNYWEAQKAQWVDTECYQKAIFWWRFALVITLGLAFFLISRPMAPEFAAKERPTFNPPDQSLIYLFGPMAVYQGVRELIDRHGALTTATYHPDQPDHVEVVFPTPALLAPLASYRKKSTPVA